MPSSKKTKNKPVTKVGLLKGIRAELKSTDATKRLRTTRCNKSAVCWNWVIYGAKNEIEAEPSPYYQAIAPKSYIIQDPQIKTITTTPTLTAHLEKAKELAVTKGGTLKKRVSLDDLETAQAEILKALLKDKGFGLEEASDLKARAWFTVKNGATVFNHIELVYDDAITITKGIDEDLYAIEGLTEMPKGDACVDVGIDPETLSEQHRAALEGLYEAELEEV